jgi:hypothetical protein
MTVEEAIELIFTRLCDAYSRKTDCHLALRPTVLVRADEVIE